MCAPWGLLSALYVTSRVSCIGHVTSWCLVLYWSCDQPCVLYCAGHATNCVLYCTGHVTSHVSCTVLVMWLIVCLVLYWSCDQLCVLHCIGHVTSRVSCTVLITWPVACIDHVTSRVSCTVLVMWLVTCLAQYWSCDKWYVLHRTGHLTCQFIHSFQTDEGAHPPTRPGLIQRPVLLESVGLRQSSQRGGHEGRNSVCVVP